MAPTDVRFGSLADICGAISHVRFASNSDRKSGHPHKVMSALPPKADLCGAKRHVCFGPKADISLTNVRAQRAANAFKRNIAENSPDIPFWATIDGPAR